MKKKAFIFLIILIAAYFGYRGLKKVNLNSKFDVGERVDSLHNVMVFYNGGVDNVVQRNTKDGYNLGLEYQCVEFVKRYYYEHYNHKMPDSYGHAISFYDRTLSDGSINTQRDLTQYSNPSTKIPQEGDVLVMKGNWFNRYGHVAIISKVTGDQVEIIQQNPGPFAPSRVFFELSKTTDNTWEIANDRVLGWLRK